MAQTATAQITIRSQTGVYVATITPPVALIPTNSDFTDPVFSSFEFLAELREDENFILPYLTFNESVFTYDRTTGIIKIKSLNTDPTVTRFEYDFDFFTDSAKTNKVGTYRLILIKNAAASDAFTSLLSNVNESISCDNAGNPLSAVNVPCETFSFYGINPLTYTTGTPTKSQYTLRLVPENCTVSAVDSNGKFFVTSITADTARVNVIFTMGAPPHVRQTLTMSLNKTYSGDVGGNGDDGPGMLFYGEWNNTTVYPVSLKTRSVVYIMAGVNREYWMTPLRDDIAFMPVEIKPGTTGSIWEPFGASFQSVATNLLLAENAHINMLNVGEGIWFGTDGLKINNDEGIIHKNNGFQITPNGSFISPFAGINGRVTTEFVPRIYSGLNLVEAEQVIRGLDVPFNKYFVVDSNGKIYAQEAEIKGVLEASIGSRIGILSVNNNEVNVAGDGRNITITTGSVDSKFVDSPSYSMPQVTTPVDAVEILRSSPIIITEQIEQTLYELPQKVIKGSYNTRIMFEINNVQTVIKSNSSATGTQLFYSIYLDIVDASNNSIISSEAIYNYDASTFMFPSTGNITESKTVTVNKTISVLKDVKVKIRIKGNYALTVGRSGETAAIGCSSRQWGDQIIIKMDGINQQMIIGSDGIGVMVNADNYFKITQTPNRTGIRLQGTFPTWSLDLPVGTIYRDSNSFLKVIT